MTLTSPAFKYNGTIPAKYTCDGDDISPPLEITGVPEGAQSLVLICDDPDAPGGTWVHWTMWNIAPGTTQIAESSTPAGATEGVTSFGRTGWGGPCPPSGTHRYFFKLYALDTVFDLTPKANSVALEAAIKGHVLAQCELVGRY